jgi:hypothetical protein
MDFAATAAAAIIYDSCDTARIRVPQYKSDYKSVNLQSVKKCKIAETKYVCAPTF